MLSRENRIIKKYSKLIDRAVKKYSDKTMGELWVELDKIKERMREELGGASQ